MALMVLANTLLPTHNATGVHKFRPRSFPVPSRSAAAGGGSDGGDGGGGGSILSAFTRWDAAWFLSIADAGYPGDRSSADLDDDTDEAVDCAGTRRAWGGEDYHEYASEGGKDYKLEEEGDREEEQKEQEQEYERSSSHRSRRCRADIPLEDQAHAFFPLYPLSLIHI